MSALIDRLTETRTFRLRMALVMAAVSLISAYVTHVATERGATVGGLNGLASQQWAEEQQVEQQFDAIVAQDRRITARIDEYLHTYRQSYDRADAVRAAEPARAARLDLEAQANLDQVNQLFPFLRAARPDLTGPVAAYDVDAARQVLRITDWRLFRGSSELTRAQATEAREIARSTVLIVVTLVAALFLLTLAHLAGGRRGLALATLGLTAAIGAVAWFTALEAPAALPLLVGAALVVGALLVIRMPRVRDWLAGLDEEGVAGDVAAVPTRPGTSATANPNDPPSTRFNRFVAVAIASATLLGAGVGYLHGGASSSGDAQAWQARDFGVEGIGALRAAEERLAVDIETYQLALSHHVEAWNAAQLASYADWTGDAAEADRMQGEAERLEELAQRSEERSGLSDELGSTGASSEAVLRGLRADVWESSARLTALQDAANAASRAWGERAGVYLSLLAWLAVAVYLLGLSAIFRERTVRVVLASIGTLLILGTVARTGMTLTEPEPTGGQDARAAADAYAAGFVAQLESDPVRADELFANAIALRPDFGIARRERAQAILETGSAPGLGLRAAFTDEAVTQAIAELTEARKQGADTAGVVLNLAAMLFHRSVQTGSQADMEESVTLSRLGLELGAEFDDKYGEPHLNQIIGEANLGLALLATGEAEEAADIYRRMSDQTLALQDYLRPYLVGAALTPLEVLREAPSPASEATITAMKDLVVSRGYGVGLESPARVASVRAELFASIVQWRAEIPGFDPERDNLVVQWYRLDPVVDGWSSLPLVSGPLKIGQVSLGGQFHPDAGEDAYWGNSSALLSDIPPTCVRSGRYRVELYLNGALQATDEAESTAEQYTPHLARDVGVAMCAPIEWSATGQAGLSTSVATADGSQGVTVFRVHEPRTPAGPDSRVTALERVLGGTQGLPEGLGPGFAINAANEPTIFGRNDAVWRLHSFPDGLAKTSATYLGSGTVLVVCVYGPEAWILSPEATALILSMITY